MELVALLLASILALSNAGVLERFNPRIVNGEDAAPGEIPYQVSLQQKGINFHFCGGSVLNEIYVITAAHCVIGKHAAGIQVVAGTTNLLTPGSVHNVEKIIIHQRYSPRNSWIHDIALIKVKTPFVKSNQVSFVALPKSNQVVNANDIAVVSGWGRLYQGGPTTKKLQRVDIRIADVAYCKSVYEGIGYNVHDTQVCAYDKSTMKGSCHGDSGGPLTVRGELTGLVSWANGCASTKFPTVYTRVSKYVDWIRSHAV